jgi:hypothetical protein
MAVSTPRLVADGDAERLDRIEQKLDRLLSILEPAVDPADADLLLELFRVSGGGTFTAKDVFTRAELGTDQGLRSALQGADLETARDLGWTLRRLERRAVAGFVVTAAGRSRDGGLWQLATCSSHLSHDRRLDV